MDADDISLPTRIEKQKHYMDENSDVCIVGSNIIAFGEKYGTLDSSKLPDRTKDKDIYAIRCLLEHSGPPHPTFMIRSEFLKSNNIKYDENILKAQDYALMADCLMAKGIIRKMDESLLKYRKHDEQITSREENQQKHYQELVSQRYLSFVFNELTARECKILSTLYSDKFTYSPNEYKSAIARIIELNNDKKIYNQEKFESEFKYEWKCKLKRVCPGVMGLTRKIWKNVWAIVSNKFVKIGYGLSKLVPDKIYVQRRFSKKLGRKINLQNPVKFNDKINWLKLNDRRDEYTMMADKYEVRKYVSDTIGEEYLIPIIGVWDKPEDIDFDSLPEQFVLKCTHDSASVIICKDKSGFDRQEAIEKLNYSMKINYYWYSREWVYKNIKPRVIAEKYMVDETRSELKDYKVYDFNGKPEIIQVDFGRFVHHERNLYSTEWKYINEQIEYPKNPKVQIDKPERLDLMLELASKLSKGIPFVRTDFYSIGDRLYFGEMTFYPEAGFARFESEGFEKKLGDMIKL
jgi:hypothetical protein